MQAWMELQARLIGATVFIALLAFGPAWLASIIFWVLVVFGSLGVAIKSWYLMYPHHISKTEKLNGFSLFSLVYVGGLLLLINQPIIAGLAALNSALMLQLSYLTRDEKVCEKRKEHIAWKELERVMRSFK